MTTTTTPDPTSAELRPGQHVEIAEGVLQVRHVEPMHGGYAVMLKSAGRVTVRQVEAVHRWRVASADAVAAAQGAEVRTRLHEDLQAFLELVGRKDVLPVGPDTSLYLTYQVPDYLALRNLADYLGVQIRDTDHHGKPRTYATVQFPPALDIEGPMPFLVEFMCKNPDYDE
jgi:hypothetical protein